MERKNYITLPCITLPWWACARSSVCVRSISDCLRPLPGRPAVALPLPLRTVVFVVAVEPKLSFRVVADDASFVVEGCPWCIVLWLSVIDAIADDVAAAAAAIAWLFCEGLFDAPAACRFKISPSVISTLCPWSVERPAYVKRRLPYWNKHDAQLRTTVRRYGTYSDSGAYHNTFNRTGMSRRLCPHGQ